MKTDRLYHRLIAAALTGIRAHRTGHKPTAAKAAEYAIADAKAVLDALSEPTFDERIHPLVTANSEMKKLLESAQAQLGVARREVEVMKTRANGIAARLASVLWTLPGSTIRIEEGHTSLLTGRSWEVEQKPAGPGAYTLTLLVGPKDGPPPLRPVPAPQREDEEDPELPQPPVKADA